MNTATLTAPPPAASAAPDLVALKARQQGAWSSGDYAIVGATLQIVGEDLCEALDLRSGQKVLDVAAGNGNVTLAAARRWCDVVSTDYVPALLERGRARAQAEGWRIEFKEADAESLPFADGAFDAVVSTFGVMFTPNQDKAAAELLRVCRPGGKIGLANWTPEGFIGQVFKAIGKQMPPPAGVKSPALWGAQPRINEMFGAARRIDQPAQARIHVPLPLAGALDGGLQDLLRSAAEDLRCASRGEAGRIAQRSDESDCAAQPREGRHDGGAERIRRDCHHQAIMQFGRPPTSRCGEAAAVLLHVQQKRAQASCNNRSVSSCG